MNRFLVSAFDKAKYAASIASEMANTAVKKPVSLEGACTALGATAVTLCALGGWPAVLSTVAGGAAAYGGMRLHRHFFSSSENPGDRPSGLEEVEIVIAGRDGNRETITAIRRSGEPLEIDLTLDPEGQITAERFPVPKSQLH